MPRRRGVLGEHLVTDTQGTVRLASEVVRGQNGRQKGQLVHPRDFDEPGRFDLPQVRPVPRPMAGPAGNKPRQTWRVRDENGDSV